MSEREELRALLAEADGWLVVLLYSQQFNDEANNQVANLRDRITAALAEKDSGGCQWSPDDDFELGDTWHGDCGAVWTFTDGGPEENHMKFCPNCGGAVSLPPLPTERKV